MNFKVITGYPDYLISESGEIFSLKSDRNLKLRDGKVQWRLKEL